MKKLKIFYKILKSIHVITFINIFLISCVLASILLTLIEPQLTSIGDSLWFTFASVTTIGYGDFTPVTPIGRIITVMITLYGILVVSIITASIVRFIGAIQKAKTQNTIDILIGELENLEELDKEQLKKLSEKIREENI